MGLAAEMPGILTSPPATPCDGKGRAEPSALSRSPLGGVKCFLNGYKMVKGFAERGDVGAQHPQE